MKTIVISCTFSIMLLAGSAASAGPLTWAQVGNLDTLVPGGKTTLPNSNPVTEKEWIASVLGISPASLTYTQLPAAVSNGDNWQQVGNTTDIFALELGADPEWFMIKTGAGAENRNFLFENNDDLGYAVIDFDELGFGEGATIGKISHVGIADGLTTTTQNLTPVPEPASLTLLAAGLAAVGAKMRRRRKQPAQ